MRMQDSDIRAETDDIPCLIWTLRRIMRMISATPIEKPITYALDNKEGWALDKQKRILFLLENANVITILENFSSLPSLDPKNPLVLKTLPDHFPLWTEPDRISQKLAQLEQAYPEISKRVITKDGLTGDAKLNFFTDGRAEFRGVVATFRQGSKQFCLLKLLDGMGNGSVTIEDVKRHCDPEIYIERYRFRGIKDVYDTIRGIRAKLKVQRGDFFPIQKRKESEEHRWIWLKS